MKRLLHQSIIMCTALGFFLPLSFEAQAGEDDIEPKKIAKRQPSQMFKKKKRGLPKIAGKLDRINLKIEESHDSENSDVFLESVRNLVTTTEQKVAPLYPLEEQLTAQITGVEKFFEAQITAFQLGTNTLLKDQDLLDKFQILLKTLNRFNEELENAEKLGETLNSNTNPRKKKKKKKSKK